jgi:hypothetical protein
MMKKLLLSVSLMGAVQPHVHAKDFIQATGIALGGTAIAFGIGWGAKLFVNTFKEQSPTVMIGAGLTVAGGSLLAIEGYVQSCDLKPGFATPAKIISLLISIGGYAAATANTK